jgi:PKD repeat protein
MLLICAFQSYSQQYFKVSSSTNCLPGTVKIYDVDKSFKSYQLKIGDATISYSGADTTIYLKFPSFSMILSDMQNFPYYDYAYLNNMKVGTSINFLNASCPSTPVSFSAYGENSSGTWEINNQSYTGESFSLTFPSVGKYLVSYQGTSFCGNVEYKEYVNISDTLSPEISLTAFNDSVCPGESVSFSVFKNGRDSIVWDFGDGKIRKSTDSYMYHTYSKAGKYKVLATVTNGCRKSKTASTEVNISNNIVPQSTYLYLPDSVCINQNIRFSASGNSSREEWNFGDGGTIVDFSPYHEYTTTGKKYVTLKFTNKCGLSSVITDSLVVRDDLKPGKPVLYLPDSVCPFENFYVRTSSDYDKVTWDLGDGNVIMNNYFYHSYSSPGPGIITLTVTNECGISTVAMDTVIVNNNVSPEAFLHIGKSTVCPGETIQLSTSDRYKFVEWKFDNTTIKSGYAISHSLENAGTHTIELTVTNMCNLTSSDKKTITVSPDAVEPDIRISGPGFGSDSEVFCLQERLEWEVSVNGGTVNWNFGDGITGNYGNHTYTSPGSYYPTATITTPCGKTYSFKAYNPVIIKSQFPYSEYHEEFDIEPINENFIFCPGEPVLLAADLPGTRFIWNFGDGTVKESTSVITGSHSYKEEGIYKVALTAFNGCNADTTIYQSITVQNQSHVESDEDEFFISTSSICVNDYLNAISLRGGSYSFDFGDNSAPVITGEKFLIDNELEVLTFRHKYVVPGNYVVTVTKTDFCGGKKIKKYPVTVAAADDKSGLATMIPLMFEYEVATPCKSIPFFVSSGSSFKWNFGDGTAPFSTTEPMVKHTYSKSGRFYPAVEVTNGCGITHTVENRWIDAVEKCTPAETMDEKTFATAVSVFPNPVTDILHLNVPAQKSGQLSLKVFNIAGVLVDELISVNRSDMNINVSALESGLYILKAESHSEVYTIKFNKL